MANKRLKTARNEFLFIVVVYVIMLFFSGFSRIHPWVNGQEFVFFLNYVAVALIISYWFLPKLYYHKKYLLFMIAAGALVFGSMLIEELLLEKIFFSGDRSSYFNAYALIKIIPLVLVMCGAKFAWDATIKQREVEELRTAVKESELQFLKSQINPHFLFNNLNNLYAYAVEQSPKVPDLILELSSVLRYMLYECQADYVALQKEVVQLENYCRLHQLQIEDRGSITVQSSGINNTYKIAPLILMVFVENAFKHSTSTQTDEIIIEISIDLATDGLLHFQCKNNYSQQSSNTALDKGIGLINVKKRLELLYPAAHTLEIKATPTEYWVDLQMNLQPNV